MAEELVHEGSRSWWSGRFKALCGMTAESGDAENVWFRKVTCPRCIAAKKAK